MTFPTESGSPSGLGIPYLGIPQSNPGNNWYRRRDPLPSDYRNYQVGDRWCNLATGSVFVLGSKAAGKSNWGAAINLGGVSTFVGNSGTASPSAGVINLVGSGGTVVTGSGNTLTVNSTFSQTQTAFFAYLSGTQSNVTGDGSLYGLIANNVAYNRGSGYNATTGQFTAPSTGVYSLSAAFDLTGLTSSHTKMLLDFVIFGGSMSTRQWQANPYAMSTSGELNVPFSLSISLTAGQSVQPFAIVYNGAKVVSAYYDGADASCYFSGFGPF